MSKKPSLMEMLAFGEHEDITTLSLEAAETEYEVEIYLSGYDIDQIESMSVSKEGQEQWGIYVPKTDKNAASGSVRVRKTTTDDEVIHEIASKASKGEQGRDEAEDKVDEGHFKIFEQLADQGLIKTRYHVPHQLEDGTEFIFDVDTFRNKSNELVPWVKIDAELKEGTEFTVKDIPFKYDEVIIVTPGLLEKDEKLKKRVNALYEKYFRSSNTQVE